MKKNEGNLDRVIRVVLGVGIIGAGVYMQNWLGLIGIVPLATAAMGWCPLYSIIGVSSCKVAEKT